MARMKKSLLDLRFSPDMEEKYREASFDNSIFIYRVLGILGAAIYGLFFLSDYRDFPAFIEQAFVIRFMFVIPVLLFISAVSFTPFARRWIKPLACLGLLSAEGGGPGPSGADPDAPGPACLFRLHVPDDIDYELHNLAGVLVEYRHVADNGGRVWGGHERHRRSVRAGD